MLKIPVTVLPNMIQNLMHICSSLVYNFLKDWTPQSALHTVTLHKVLPHNDIG